MKRFHFRSKIIAICLALSLSVSAHADGYTLLPSGAHLQVGEGLLRVEFVTPDIVRVRYTLEPDFLGNGTIVCVGRREGEVPFQAQADADMLTLSSDSLQVCVDRHTYAVRFTDRRTGQVLLAEDGEKPREGEAVYQEKVTYDPNSKRIVKTADGEKEVMEVAHRDTVGSTWKYRVHFRWQPGEALYGLGCHMEDYLNLRGKRLFLCQHNLKEMVPVLNSTAGYGLLFDAGCAMVYADDQAGSYMELEAANEIDYYFMKGQTMDKVVERYHYLTGDAPMLPRYMFGYIQSKERYTNSQELVDVVKEYRRRQVPLDVIVQDWNYWPAGQWGHIKMDRRFYPDPKALADSIHALDAKLMISIWPNPTNCPQTEDFARRGFMLDRSVYDAFNPKARALYWEYANLEFFSNGFDAWWCDCTEPLDADWHPMPKGYGWNNQEARWRGNTELLSDVLGAERASLYSLYHSKGLYEHQRATTDRKRVVNLTRSSYAGQQRFGTITWNGDTHASWRSFRQQIPQGLNFMATGCSYWTVDIGSFFTRKGGEWFRMGDFDHGVDDMGYREYYTRMFQFATFLPLTRSHGTDTPREIWRFGNPGEPFYESVLRMIRLRYHLLPYNYSLAAQASMADYTMSRLLAFDFPQDTLVYDIKDEFMWGKAFLVCPVTEPMYYDKGSVELKGVSKTRSVYLPAGANWIDYWTGKSYKGGQTIEAAAPIEQLPLFVRQGSIVPTAPALQHTGELPGKVISLEVYPGKDASFTLYEDEGDNYDYERGICSNIHLQWDEENQELTLWERVGEFPGMERERDFRVVLHKANGKIKEKTIHYTGEKATCRF